MNEAQILLDFDEALTTADADLRHLRDQGGDLGAQIATSAELMRWLFDGGWIRWGWPEEVGGCGGSSTVRCQLLERLAQRGYEIPHHLLVLEVVGPAIVNHAPGLAAELLPARCVVTNCGARASPNPRRAATWPRCGPGLPPVTTTPCWCRDRRSGRPTVPGRTGW